VLLEQVCRQAFLHRLASHAHATDNALLPCCSREWSRASISDAEGAIERPSSDAAGGSRPAGGREAEDQSKGSAAAGAAGVVGSGSGSPAAAAPGHRRGVLGPGRPIAEAAAAGEAGGQASTASSFSHPSPFACVARPAAFLSETIINHHRIQAAKRPPTHALVRQQTQTDVPITSIAA